MVSRSGVFVPGEAAELFFTCYKTGAFPPNTCFARRLERPTAPIRLAYIVADLSRRSMCPPSGVYPSIGRSKYPSGIVPARW